MFPKVAWRSKTLWYNVLTIVVFIATMFFGYQQNNELVDTLQKVFTNPLVIALINAGLRMVTKQSVSLTDTSLQLPPQ